MGFPTEKSIQHAKFPANRARLAENAHCSLRWKRQHLQAGAAKVRSRGKRAPKACCK